MNNNESKNFLSFKVTRLKSSYESIVMRNFSRTFLLAAERVEKKKRREKKKKKRYFLSAGRFNGSGRLNSIVP